MDTARTRSTVYVEEFGTNTRIDRTRTGNCSGMGDWSEVIVTPTTYRKKYHSKVMSDVVNDRFEYWRAKGRIFNNPLEITITKEEVLPVIRSSTGTVKTYGCTPTKRWYTSNESEQYGSWEPVHSTIYYIDPSDSISIDTLKSQAVASAYAKVSVAEALTLVTLKETKETVRTMINVSRKFVNILKMMTRRNYLFKLKKLTFRDLADSWLEARYGLRPLYYDIHGVIAALNAELRRRRQTFRGWTADASDRLETDVFNWTQAAWGRGTSSVNRFVNQTINVRAGVLASIESVTLINAFGLDRFGESLFDMIPFSFIVNWFFNCQDTIGSWTPNFGIKDLASWVVTEKTTTQLVILEQNVVPIQSTSTKSYDGINSTSVASKWREVTSIIREPNPQRAILPTVSVNLDVAKIIDLALIAKSLWFRGGNTSLYRQALAIEAKLRRRN